MICQSYKQEYKNCMDAILIFISKGASINAKDSFKFKSFIKSIIESLYNMSQKIVSLSFASI